MSKTSNTPIESKLTPKQEIFVNKYIETNNATKSALESYNTDSPNVAGVIGYENLRKPNVKNAVDSKREQVLAKIESETMELVSCLLDLAKNPDVPDHVRIKAITDLLDRANVTKQKQEIAINGNMTITPGQANLATRARELLQTSNASSCNQDEQD